MAEIQPDNLPEESLLSLLDIFILSLIAGISLYWYFFIRRKPEYPVIRPIVVPPPSTKEHSSFITKMKSSNRNVIVFYGSQTGTAEEFSNRLAKDASRYGMKAMVADPDEYDMEDLQELKEIENSLAMFCLATYGEGDPTDNTEAFYNWLQSADEDLSGLNYAVFGLGNKTYEHYNAMGKYVDKKLCALGATRVCELGLGDDDTNIEEDFMNWRECLWPSVCDFYGVEATGDEINTRQFSLTVHDDVDRSRVFTGEITRLGSYKNQKLPFDVKNPYLAPIIVNRELHKGGNRSCLHVELDISDAKIRYDAGDHVGIYPTNDPEIVEALAQRLNFDLDTVFTLSNIDEEASKKHPFPCPCSFRTALSHYVDVTHPPNRKVLKEIAEYANSQEEKQFLLTLSSNTEDGKRLFNDWITSSHRSILAVLEDLPSLNPPIDYLCELLPHLQPRYYSISSSSKVHPTSIHITAVVIDFHTSTNRHYKGVATWWLKLKQPHNNHKHFVPIFVRKSQFRLPFKPSTPILMIGPGTGIAPFRGFLQQRDFLRKQDKPIGTTVLYFGCRRKCEDYLYEEELNEYVRSGTLTSLHVAFSRDQDHKVYVQHLMDQCREEVWDILSRGGHVYICGDAHRMSKEVHHHIVECLKCQGKMTHEQAEDYIKKLQEKGKYSCDVWS